MAAQTILTVNDTAGGTYHATPPVLVDGAQSELQLDVNGQLKIAGSIVSSNPSVGVNGATIPGSSTLMGWDDGGGNLQPVSAANPLPISGSFSASFSEPVLNVVGSATSATTLTNFPLNPTTGYRSVAVQVTSVGAGCTLVAEESNDGTTWTGLQSLTDTVTQTATAMAAIGLYVFNFTGIRVRVRCSVYGSGTPAVNAEFRQNPTEASIAAALALINASLVAPLPAGGNVIGAVTQSGTWTVGISAAQTIAVTNAGTFAAQLTGATNNINNIAGTISLPTGASTSSLQTSVGATAHTDAVQINTTLGSPFQAGGSIANTTFAATQSGTWNIGTVTTITGVTTAFGAISSTLPANAILDGSRGATTNPTAVTDGQLVANQSDKMGRQVIVPHAVRDLISDQKTTISNTTSETTIVTAVGSTKLDVVSITLTNSGASATKVDVRDTTGGTIRWTGYVPATDMRGIVFPVPMPQTTVNTNWTAQCSVATTALEVTVQYAKNT